MKKLFFVQGNVSQYVSGFGFNKLQVGFPPAPFEYAATRVNLASALLVALNEAPKGQGIPDTVLRRRQTIKTIFQDRQTKTPTIR